MTKEKILEAIESIKGIHDIIETEDAFIFPQPYHLSLDYVVFFLMMYFGVKATHNAGMITVSFDQN